MTKARIARQSPMPADFRHGMHGAGVTLCRYVKMAYTRFFLTISLKNTEHSYQTQSAFIPTKY